MKMDDYAAHQEPRIFWKLQRHSAPELTRLMLRLYAFPVHSASVERLWSERGADQDAQQDGFREGLPDREGQESAVLQAQGEAAGGGGGTAAAAAGPQHGAA